MSRLAVVRGGDERLIRLLAPLRERGHEFLSLRDAAEAVLAAPLATCDLLVASADAPGLDDVELCTAVRASFPAASLPILLVSASHPAEQAILAALAAGADDYLVRPRRAVLLAKARHHLEARATPRAPRGGGPEEEARSSASTAKRHPTRVGPYRLGPVVGSGGYGVVYAAERVPDGRRVALKVLRPDIDVDEEETRARHVTEAAALLLVDSPYVVRALDSGVDDGWLYLAMELLDGVPAADLVAARGPLPWSVVARIGRDASRGLRALARSGLVHRDVKPGNVLIRRGGPATLIDLGLARSHRGGVTLTGDHVLLGTAPYMAPEVVTGDPPTPKSDLYALGATLYELAAGAAPFDGPTPFAVLAEIARREGRVPDLRARRPDAPPALPELIRGLTDADPDRRVHAMRRAEAVFDRLLTVSRRRRRPRTERRAG